ncbi:MAG: hypothetical protein ACR2JS_08850 [Candidatus Nanopelagicales bacterium]
MAFSAHEVLEESWGLSKRSYWRWWPVLIVAVILPTVLQLIATGFGAWANDAGGFGGFILGLISVVFGVVALLVVVLMILGIFRNAYAVSGGESPSVARLFERGSFWWFLVAGLIYIAMLVIGLLAFIIPGLIIAFMFSLFPYALISGNAGNGFSALATSWDRITSNFWKYIGLRIVLIGVPIAVLIAALLVGGIVATGAAGGGFLLGVLAVIGGIALILL